MSELDEQKYVTPQNLQNNQPYERVRMVARPGRTSSVRRSSPQQSGGTEAAGLRGEPVVQSRGFGLKPNDPPRVGSSPPPWRSGTGCGDPRPEGGKWGPKKTNKKYLLSSPLSTKPNGVGWRRASCWLLAIC